MIISKWNPGRELFVPTMWAPQLPKIVYTPDLKGLWGNLNMEKRRTL